jgi:hypothetical protein
MMYEHDPLGKEREKEQPTNNGNENPEGDYEENDVELEDGSDDLVSPDADEGVDNLE